MVRNGYYKKKTEARLKVKYFKHDYKVDSKEKKYTSEPLGLFYRTAVAHLMEA